MSFRMARIFLIVVMLSVFVAQPLLVKADNSSVNSIDSNDIDLIQIKEELSIKKIYAKNDLPPFSCFAVNSEGEYVIGVESLNKDYILLYSPDGVFQYGFSFDLSSSFVLGLNNKNILLFLVRSDLLLSIDENGNIIEVKELSESDEYEYWQNEVYSNRIIINDTTYTAEHQLINNEHINWGAYHRLIKISTNDNQTVLYESNTANFDTSVFLVISAIIVCSAAIIFTVAFKHTSKKTEN